MCSMTTEQVLAAATPPTSITLRRLAKGLSQAQLSELLGTSRETVSRMETGEVWPFPPRIKQLASIYEAPLGDLCVELIAAWESAHPSPEVAP